MTERLDRIEAILDRLAIGIEETKALANSNTKITTHTRDARTPRNHQY
jgi:hypothetical protein